MPISQLSPHVYGKRYDVIVILTEIRKIDSQLLMLVSSPSHEVMFHTVGYRIRVTTSLLSYMRDTHRKICEYRYDYH
jgi:hypothetical protein